MVKMVDIQNEKKTNILFLKTNTDSVRLHSNVRGQACW